MDSHVLNLCETQSSGFVNLGIGASALELELASELELELASNNRKHLNMFLIYGKSIFAA